MPQNTCIFAGCINPIRTVDYCNGHRLQLQRGQTLRPLRRRGRPADPCVFDGCTRPQKGHGGLCDPHAKQMARTGRLQALRPTKAPALDRLAHYIDERGADECWPWTGQVNDAGYGIISIDGKPRRAHRVAWEAENGPLAPDEILDHFRCYNRACCNLRHLRVTDKLHNCQNRAGATSKTGYRNVYATKAGRFFVTMTANRQTYYGGTFDTPELADARARELRAEVMPGAQW